MELDTADYTILDEALDAWVDKDLATGLVSSLFDAMLVQNNPEAKSKFEEKTKREAIELKNKKDIRKRQATILKAKLYELSAATEAKRIAESAAAT